MDKTLSGTGRRFIPGLSNTVTGHIKLSRFAETAIREAEPTMVVSGMAMGWDLALATAAFVLGVPFIAAVPFEGQCNQWPEWARDIYYGLLKRAHKIAYPARGVMGKRCFVVRDHWMVDNSDGLMALWEGEKRGGTYITIKYALEKNKPYLNYWSAWSAYAGSSNP